MEKHKPTAHVLTPESHKKAPPYHAPTLTTYGSVAKLTQGGSGSAVDAPYGCIHCDQSYLSGVQQGALVAGPRVNSISRNAARLN